jgi:hypothetical protein
MSLGARSRQLDYLQELIEPTLISENGGCSLIQSAVDITFVAPILITTAVDD